jgi:hypothetical protein
MCNFDGVKFGMYPLITFDDGFHVCGKENRTTGNAHDKFFVLIDDVEIVDDPKRISQRVGGVIRLKFLDQAEGVNILDQFYFSFVTSTVVRLERSVFEHGKVNPFVFGRSSNREIPSNVIEARPEMVDDFACKNTEPWWDHAISVVMNRLKELLSIIVWENGVRAFLKEEGDTLIQIKNVLFGPF